MEIPNEVLLEIISFVDHDNLFKIRLVSKKFSHELMSENFFDNLIKKQFPTYHKHGFNVFKNVMFRYSRLTTGARVIDLETYFEKHFITFDADCNMSLKCIEYNIDTLEKNKSRLLPGDVVAVRKLNWYSPYLIYLWDGNHLLNTCGEGYALEIPDIFDLMHFTSSHWNKFNLADYCIEIGYIPFRFNNYILEMISRMKFFTKTSNSIVFITGIEKLDIYIFISDLDDFNTNISLNGFKHAFLKYSCQYDDKDIEIILDNVPNKFKSASHEILYMEIDTPRWKVFGGINVKQPVNEISTKQTSNESIYCNLLQSDSRDDLLSQFEDIIKYAISFK